MTSDSLSPKFQKQITLTVSFEPSSRAASAPSSAHFITDPSEGLAKIRITDNGPPNIKTRKTEPKTHTHYIPRTIRQANRQSDDYHPPTVPNTPEDYITSKANQLYTLLDEGRFHSTSAKRQYHSSSFPLLCLDNFTRLTLIFTTLDTLTPPSTQPDVIPNKTRSSSGLFPLIILAMVLQQTFSNPFTFR